jgi:hypothetical protein
MQYYGESCTLPGWIGLWLGDGGENARDFLLLVKILPQLVQGHDLLSDLHNLKTACTFMALLFSQLVYKKSSIEIYAVMSRCLSVPSSHRTCFSGPA